MHRSLVYALLAMSVAWAAAQAGAQSAPATAQAAPQAGPTLAPGTVLGAELSKGIDAKKAKVGQEVVAKAVADLRDNNGNLVIPRGAKLVGHITQAQAASKEQPQSSLGIIFDKVEAKHGQELGLHAGIQALAKPEPSPMTQGQEPEGPSGPGGGGGARVAASREWEVAAAVRAGWAGHPCPSSVREETWAATWVDLRANNKVAVAGLR